MWAMKRGLAPRPLAGEGLGRGAYLKNKYNFSSFKQYITALATAWILACSLPVYAAEITYFYDGDTVKIKDASYEYKLRLTDIDAPERNQTYGLKSRRALMNFCKGTKIFVAISGTDKYKRRLGKLLCNQQDTSIFMVKNGHAWFNRRYSMDYMLALQEDEARKNKLGLWESQQPTPPWVWRKSQLH
jgi:micrococcal nuclease